MSGSQCGNRNRRSDGSLFDLLESAVSSSYLSSYSIRGAQSGSNVVSESVVRISMLLIDLVTLEFITDHTISISKVCRVLEGLRSTDQTARLR
jgi:hypothetical protein